MKGCNFVGGPAFDKEEEKRKYSKKEKEKMKRKIGREIREAPTYSIHSKTLVWYKDMDEKIPHP